MSRISDLSMNAKLLLLASIFLSVFILFGGVTFSTLNTVKVDGTHYNKIVADKNLMADILPPPAFIIESSWLTRQMLDATTPEQFQELKNHFARLKQEYDASISNWNAKIDDPVLKDELLGKSQVAARSFFRTVEDELLPALFANNKARVEELIKTRLDSDFKAHFAAIGKVVERNKEIEAADQALATATVNSRTRMLLGMAFVLIGTVVGFTLWLRKSVLVQERINADYAGQIAAIGRSQAVIEFDPSGNILTANENFLSVTGYTLDEIKGRHHSLFVDETYRNSAEYRDFWPNLAKGKPSAGEHRRLGKGGKEVWIQATYNPILGPDGTPFKVVKYATNTTAQRVAEVELRNKVNSIL